MFLMRHIRPYLVLLLTMGDNLSVKKTFFVPAVMLLS